MPTGNLEGALRIGEWDRRSPRSISISRGTETHKLEPRTMRLLICLANSAGEVVSVDHLLTEVWTGVIVGPASVYQAVSQLRKLLGDQDPEPTYIATVPRKGYRLIAAVKPIETANETAPVAEGAATPPRAQGTRGAASGRQTTLGTLRPGRDRCSRAPCGRCVDAEQIGEIRHRVRRHKFDRRVALRRYVRG